MPRENPPPQAAAPPTYSTAGTGPRLGDAAAAASRSIGDSRSGPHPSRTGKTQNKSGGASDDSGDQDVVDAIRGRDTTAYNSG